MQASCHFLCVLAHRRLHHSAPREWLQSGWRTEPRNRRQPGHGRPLQVHQVPRNRWVTKRQWRKSRRVGGVETTCVTKGTALNNCRAGSQSLMFTSLLRNGSVQKGSTHLRISTERTRTTRARDIWQRRAPPATGEPSITFGRSSLWTHNWMAHRLAV